MQVWSFKIIQPTYPIHEKLFVFIIVLIFPSLFGGDFKKDAVINRTGKLELCELKYQFSFPSENLLDKNVYLRRAWNFESDKSNNFYIADARAHRIIKFNSMGSLLKIIGQKGQGPGDLNSPRRIRFLDDHLVVFDALNRRFQYLSSKGKYFKSFKASKSYHDFVTTNRGRIIGVPRLINRQNKLLEVLDDKGLLIDSFGKGINFKRNITQMNKVKIALDEDGNIFVAFVFLPVVRKYSRKGELVFEIRLQNESNETNIRREKLNIRIASASVDNQPIGFYPIIRAIRYCDKRLFVLCDCPSVEIFTFTEDGKYVMKYWANQGDRYAVEDFIIQSEGRDKMFYLLSSFPENKVDVFIPSKNPWPHTNTMDQ